MDIEKFIEMNYNIKSYLDNNTIYEYRKIY